MKDSIEIISTVQAEVSKGETIAEKVGSIEIIILFVILTIVEALLSYL